MSLPLEGVRVLDVSQVMAGPYCTLMLADMGADVIKVEKPSGDDARRFGPPFLNGESAPFMSVNRNKRSIVINLRQPEGKKVFRELARRADILVENFRPGTMKKLGQSYEDLREVNPGLIYCSISGFGQTGPYSDRGGFDLIAQGMSGIMSFTGEPGRPPVKVGVPIADLNTGMYALYGIVMAYIHKLQTGDGQRVDASLLESALAYTFWESSIYFASGKVAQPVGSAHRIAAPYQAFKTKDGYITVGGANQANWERICRVLGRTDLLEDPRFETNAHRVRRRDELAALLEETLQAQPSEYWLARLQDAGVPCGPVNNIAQAWSDPQVLARDMVVETEHPAAGTIKNIGVPVKLSQTPGQIRRSAPLLGEHTEEILKELGMSQEEIGGLKEKGVVE